MSTIVNRIAALLWLVVVAANAVAANAVAANAVAANAVGDDASAIVSIGVAAPAGGVKQLWVYLPPGYRDAADGQRYPVVYMTDGQDLFYPSPYFPDNPLIAPSLQRRLRGQLDHYGSWRINQRLDRLISSGRLPAMIVVGIASNDGRRTAEYSPWPLADEPRPAAETFAAFLADVVKPLIDASFRTLPERHHTLLIGSSMGGLFALYAGFRHAATFGRVAALSPLLSAPTLTARLSALATQARPPPLRVYIDLGDREPAFGPIEPLAAALRRAGYRREQLRVRRIAGGRHRIADWGARFGEVVLWLYPPQAWRGAAVPPADR